MITIHINPYVFWGLALVLIALVIVSVIAWVTLGSFAASINRAAWGILDRTSRKAPVPHFHRDDRGFVHKCFHRCTTSIKQPSFWLGLTMGFPLEHLLWEKVWPFLLITRWLGLH